MTEQGCNNCKHWHGGMVCDAYPEGIPWPIMSGDVSHLEPLPDDNGLQWEQAPERDLADGAPQDESNG